MNLNDLYEMKDPRDAYQRDVDNSTSGFGKDSYAYRMDGGANDENHALDKLPTWYIRLNGKLIRDKAGNPYSFQSKAAANKAALTMQAKLFNKDKEFMLTTNPNDKPQGMAEGSQRVDSLVTDALKIMQGATMNDAVAALKTVLGNREYNDRRGHYSFYVRQLMDMYGKKDVAEGKGPLGQGDLGLALRSLGGNWSSWYDTESSDPDIEKYEYDDGEGGYYASGSIEHNLKTGEIEVHYQDSESDVDVDGTFNSIGDAMKALRGGNNYPSWGGKKPNFDRLGQRKQHGPDDLRKTDRTGRKGTLAGGPSNDLKRSIQWAKGKHGPQGVLPEGVLEGYDDGMHPIDLSSNPSFKDIVQRYTQLVYQGHASETSPEEDQEYDAIEQYVADRFGEKGSAHLQKAGEVSYWGRDDKPYGRDSRSSNLGWPSMPGGNFRTTKAGKMHKQDAGSKKDIIGNRLGRHPDPVLPEGAEFGANYAEQLAQKVFNVKPELASEDDVLNIGHKVATQDLMSQVRANYLFARDQDFPSDFVSAYYYLQKQGLAEGDEDIAMQDSGEYDYEGDMAKDDLKTIVRAAHKLTGMLDDNENMPEWVQSKINKAADYVDTAADYIESNQEPELGEGEKIGNMDADAFDDAMTRLKKLAGAGPMKTVYDPEKRVYKNIPTAVQPAQQPKK